jgi:hypothetical protein
MRPFTVVGRVMGADVFEIGFEARSLKVARRKWLTMVGYYLGHRVTDADVVWCGA